MIENSLVQEPQLFSPKKQFRFNAAKDILCALLSRGENGISHTDLARKAVNIADALIDELNKTNE